MSDPVLVIDVGGSHVKLYPGREEPLRFDSGRDLTAAEMVQKTQEHCGIAPMARISIGFPGAVRAGRPASEPVNLGEGWKGFDFEAAFGKPVRVINDAALQALGSYKGGRMIFLGVGTALGSTLITENVIVPIQLGELRTREGELFGEVLGHQGRDAMGPEKWEAQVLDLIDAVRRVFSPDDLVIGGGLAELLPEPPPQVRRGDNRHAYRGGLRLWEALDLQKAPNLSRWMIA